MLRSARREVEIYERNRESLPDLRDAGLRARIHSLAIRLSMPLDGIFDAAQEIAAAEAQLRSRLIEAEDRNELQARLSALKERIEAGYDYILETSAEIKPLLAELGPLARHTFAPDDDVRES
jgi:DNA repair exonuclease SbcCD ATPase subunit